MASALIGFTGFVGSNLLAVRQFDELYNSRNIGDIRGREFDEVVFAAARAEKWRINQDPQADAAHIAELEHTLASIRAARVVLVSTIDVYASPTDVNEQSPVTEEGLHPYGLHRRQLEKYVEQAFPASHIVRLPGLFGRGIKKNIIFDLLHDNNLSQIHADGTFQYYDLRSLASDIDQMIEHEIPLLNIATEPITTADLAREVFHVDFTNRPERVRAGRYDMRSVHAPLWGGSDGYLYDRDSVVAAMLDFVNGEKAK